MLADQHIIPEDLGRLAVFKQEDLAGLVEIILGALQQDCVALISRLSVEQADQLIRGVAAKLRLDDSLELHAGLASIYGHRSNITKYFMTVNKRRDYQFIPPHSEGNAFLGMQLAAFFCFENSTDGGETILMNVDAASPMWQNLRDKVRRAKLGTRLLAGHEIARARALYQVDLPTDVIRLDDEVLQERRTEISDLKLVDVLAKPQRAHSRILDRDVYVYWDSTASIDFDSGLEFERLLRQSGLMKEPAGGMDLRLLDNSADRRIWRSGVRFGQLFKCKIIRKLAPGDLIIQNNLTWTHAVSNWSPGSGTRQIAAAFA